MDIIDQQINLIELEMRALGLWSDDRPEGLYRYDQLSAMTFWQWMQFVCLPEYRKSMYGSGLLATQLRTFLNGELSLYTQLIQRIIELDSLSVRSHL